MSKSDNTADKKYSKNKLIVLFNLLFIAFQIITLIVTAYIYKEISPEKMGMLFTYYLYAVIFIASLCLVYVIFKAYKASTVFIQAIPFGAATIISAIIIRMEQYSLYNSANEFVAKTICVFTICDIIAVILFTLIYRLGNGKFKTMKHHTV